MKISNLIGAVISTCLLTSTALADQCSPVTNFITLGQKAEKCVSEINLGKTPATDVLSSYGYCTNVRDARGDVEKKVSALSPSTINRCAEKNIQAYTDAAAAIHRLYQIELSLR
jgi:hypothetical protein